MYAPMGDAREADPKPEVDDSWRPSALYMFPISMDGGSLEQRMGERVNNQKVQGPNKLVEKIKTMADNTKQEFGELRLEPTFVELVEWAKSTRVHDIHARMRTWREIRGCR